MTEWNVPATVLRIVDGDTIELMLDLGWKMFHQANVRLQDVDAPEDETPEGLVSEQYVMTLLPIGSRVRILSKGKDRNGRPLGHITLPDGRDLGVELISGGYARTWKSK